MRLLISFIIIFFLGISCYYDSQEYLFPQLNNNCDTTNVTFSKSIVPILEQSCKSCHYNSVADSKGSGIKLENYADVKNETDVGGVLGAIKHTSGVPMPEPLGSPKLSDCQIATFDIWKRNNYPQ
jgi:hypothetical protein